MLPISIYRTWNILTTFSVIFKKNCFQVNLNTLELLGCLLGGFQEEFGKNTDVLLKSLVGILEMQFNLRISTEIIKDSF